jgi:hypothetical protein
MTNREWNPGEWLDLSLSGILSSIMLWTVPSTRLFSLNMLLGTDFGKAYSEQQRMDILAEAGLKDIQRLPVQTPNDTGLITGIV